MSPEFQTRLAEYMDAFEEFAAQATPQAVDLALSLTRWNALNDLIVTLLTILLGVGIFLGATALWRARTESVDIREPFAYIGWLLGGGMAIIATGSLFNVWLWLGLFRPELVLARRLLDKVMGGL